MKLSFLLFAVFSICALNGIYADDLYCFDCEGDECNNITKDMLKYCGPDKDESTTEDSSGEVSPTPSTPVSTVEPSSPSTVDFSTLSTVASPSTVASTVDGSTPTESTVASPGDGSTPTESTVASTVNGSTPTESTGDGSTPTESTVASIAGSNSTPTVDSSSTAIIGHDSHALNSTTVASSSNSTAAPISASIRRRRQILTSADMTASDLLIANYRIRSRTARASGYRYACYKLSIPDGSSSKPKHGCIKYSTTQSACGAAMEEEDISSSESPDSVSCTYCFNSECNSGAALKMSLLAMLVAVLFAVFSH